VTQVAETPPTKKEVAKSRGRRGNWLRDLIEVLLIALVLYLVIWNALQTVRVDGDSMDNTLQNQDLLLASKVSYDFGGNPSRGDIVVLIPPSDPTRDFIKRVIGVPGDVIEIDGSKSPTKMMIKPGGQGDFQTLKEPYLPETWTAMNFCCKSNGTESGSSQAVTIPPGDYFVMGDNRNRSSDSRSFGFVPRKNILAKAFLRLWPLNRFGGLGTGPSLAAGVALVPAISWLPLKRRLRRQRAPVTQRA
jgi:signal peptidase I